MAKIDNDGIAELNEKIKNPLNHMYDKLKAMGEFDTFVDEFDFIFRFLEDVENNWQRIGDNSFANPTPTVMVDGKEYRPLRG